MTPRTHKKNKVSLFVCMSSRDLSNDMKENYCEFHGNHLLSISLSIDSPEVNTLRLPKRCARLLYYLDILISKEFT